MLTYLEGWDNWAVIIRLAIATCCGSIIGWERVIRKHSAGIRTFALVCLGAAAATALNIKLGFIPGMKADISRIPAGVINGMGFLGAGTILVTGRNQIKGLTTAASLWVCATMGMVIGAGYLEIGIACFLLILIANCLLQYFSQRSGEFNRYISVYIEVDKEKGVNKLRKYVAGTDYELVSINKTKEKPLQASDVALNMVLDLKKRTKHQDILNLLSDQNYVNYVEEI